MARQPIIAANWKLHKTTGEARQFVDDLQRQQPNLQDLDAVIAAPFTALTTIQDALLARNSPFHLAAQDMFWESNGAYTGEISAAMLVDAGCTYVIIGHSERRQYFGETDHTVCRKVQAALESGLNPIVCIGESLTQREANATFTVITQQLQSSLANCQSSLTHHIVIAYEPLWAIGTGVTATPEQAQDVHHHIRSQLTEMWGENTAQRIRIQYGGSVNPENIVTLMAAPDIDGGLVGGASLDVHSFIQLLSYRG